MAYLFLHGLGQNASSWNEVIRSLNLNSEVVCPDLFQVKNDGINCHSTNYKKVNHAGSNDGNLNSANSNDPNSNDGNIYSNHINYNGVYHSLDKFLKQHHEPINLCGLSLGGMLALNYAIDNPDRVKSLVLIATQYKIPKKLMMFQNVIFKLLPNRVFDNMGLPKKNVLELTRSMLDLNFEADLGKINCPVFILCGEKDRANQKAAVELSQKIGGSQYKVIPKAGHEVNKEKPEILAELLSEFYAN